MEVFNKSALQVEPANKVTCPRCKGFGANFGDDGDCPVCEGKGECWVSESSGWTRPLYESIDNSTLY